LLAHHLAQLQRQQPRGCTADRALHAIAQARLQRPSAPRRVLP
jgi:hypothetical protein